MESSIQAGIQASTQVDWTATLQTWMPSLISGIIAIIAILIPFFTHRFDRKHEAKMLKARHILENKVTAYKEFTEIASEVLNRHLALADDEYESILKISYYCRVLASKETSAKLSTLVYNLEKTRTGTDESSSVTGMIYNYINDIVDAMNTEINSIDL